MIRWIRAHADPDKRPERSRRAWLGGVLWLLRDRSRSRASMDRVVEQARGRSEGGRHVGDRD